MRGNSNSNSGEMSSPGAAAAAEDAAAAAAAAAAVDMDDGEVAALRREVSRLNRELDQVRDSLWTNLIQVSPSISKKNSSLAPHLFPPPQASSEKVQSAQYGLVLLEEKESLESRCAELESAYDEARSDLSATQDALARFQTSRHDSVQAGIEHEESLLHESAARESSLNTQVLNMEIELKSARAEGQRLAAEKMQIEQV